MSAGGVRRGRSCRAAAGAVVIAAVAALAATWPPAPAMADAPLAPQLHTVAGGGSCTNPFTGLPCDGVAATSVSIAKAQWVAALPGGGFLYVDRSNDVVRQVSPSGSVTTVAGDGPVPPQVNPPPTPPVPTDTDGVPATQSGLADPVAVAPLPGGGFLITEAAGNRVRMVSPGPPGQATITTIAGIPPSGSGPSGPATSVSLNNPTDAEVTPGGQVLIADSGDDEIRELSAAAPGATITTVAGGGGCSDASAGCDGLAATGVQLNGPTSVSPIPGGGGAFLISENDTQDDVNAVRLVSANGTFSTVAGIPGAPLGYTGDGGPATSALLDDPTQVVAAVGGGFLIADAGNDRVREVSPTGVINTVAGNGQSAFAGDGGAATDGSFDDPLSISPTADGGLLVADDLASLIRAVTIPPTTHITLAPASPNGKNGWYVTPPVATVSATNATGTRCELDPPQAPTLFDEIPSGCPWAGGSPVLGDGAHTLAAASIDLATDKEVPVGVSFKLDTVAPTLACAGPTSIPYHRKGSISANVTDATSGPAAAHVSAGAVTSKIGTRVATLTGADQAGNTARIQCRYTVTPIPFSPRPSLTAAFVAGGGKRKAVRTTSVHKLTLRNVASQATVTISCTGQGCPFKTARNVTGKLCHRGKPCTATRSQKRGNHRTLNLAPLFSASRLAAGDRLEVSVTKANMIGRVWLYTFRSGRRPSQTVTCLTPGSSVPGKGCK